MKNLKSFKWSFALIATMSLGLSSCYMDNQSYRQADNQRTVVVKPVAPQPRIVEKQSSSSKVVREPIQQVAPGPKRTQAPQLPVVSY
jgi:hypothetical protein